MSSKRNIRRRACEGKVRHPNAPTARYAATLLNERTGEYLEAYKCGFCGGYHIGHLDRRRKQAKRARMERW